MGNKKFRSLFRFHACHGCDGYDCVDLFEISKISRSSLASRGRKRSKPFAYQSIGLCDGDGELRVAERKKWLKQITMPTDESTTILVNSHKMPTNRKRRVVSFNAHHKFRILPFFHAPYLSPWPWSEAPPTHGAWRSIWLLDNTVFFFLYSLDAWSEPVRRWGRPCVQTKKDKYSARAHSQKGFCFFASLRRSEWLVRFIRNLVFSAATGYQCYGMLYFILMGPFRAFQYYITKLASGCVWNGRRRWNGRRVKNRNSKTKEFRTHVRCSMDACRLPWKLNFILRFVSIEICVFSFWPQKCLPTLARENNNNLASTWALCARKKMCGTKEWATQTRKHNENEQNEANVMWPRRCRRLLLMLVVPTILNIAWTLLLVLCRFDVANAIVVSMGRCRFQIDWLLPISLWTAFAYTANQNRRKKEWQHTKYKI